MKCFGVSQDASWRSAQCTTGGAGGGGEGGRRADGGGVRVGGGAGGGGGGSAGSTWGRASRRLQGWLTSNYNVGFQTVFKMFLFLFSQDAARF